jgi:GT2 family glycosyltransferase
MKITLVIPTIRRYDLLEKALRSFFLGSRIPNEILIIDNGNKPGLLSLNIAPQNIKTYNIHIYTPPGNLGVAGSWNFAMGWCARNGSAWLSCNDDIEVEAGFLRLMEMAFAKINRSNELPILVPEHGIGQMFSCFMADPVALKEEIGYFDTQFFPAYFEDNDYAYRMKLLGKTFFNVVEGAYYSHKNSSTIASYSKEELIAHHQNFAVLAELYMKKWGGPPEYETFTKPYQGNERPNG